jgi:hypothetical protein
MGSTIGDLASHVEVREISEDDLPEGKFQNLIGKLGIFADQILIKSKRAIEQAQEDLLNTISAGVDVMDDVIREISVTPTPAIEGMRLFHRGNDANFALTWEQLESSKENFEEVEEQLKELNKTFAELIENIYKADIEELEGYSHNDLMVQALQEYMMRVASVIGIEEEQEEVEQEQESPQQQANQIMQRNVGKGYPNTGFSNPKYVAAFSMSDMANFNEIKVPEVKDLNNFRPNVFKKTGKALRKTGYNLGLLNIEKVNRLNEQGNAILKGGNPLKKRAYRLSKRGMGVAGVGLGLGGAYLGSKIFNKPEKKQSLLDRLF